MATKKELLEQSQKAIAEYFELSKYLFSDDGPYDVNEIPKDSPFYEVAQEIAKDLEISWENMTHEESNRLMLNLLSDYFFQIQDVDKYKPVLTVSFKKDE